ncbi:MAG: hypothetical protein WBP61_02355 [Nocardioides sp.]
MSEDPGFPTPADSGDPDGPGDPGDFASTPPEPERVRTGVTGVDEVILAVEALEERPIEEHVAVFEAAHDRLRRALDAPGDEPTDDVS